MALEKAIETLRNNNTDKKDKKVFSKKNAKGRYYSNMGKLANKPKPTPKYKPKQKLKQPDNTKAPENKVESENKKQYNIPHTPNFEHKGGFLNKAFNGIYQSLVDTGYLADLEDHDEDFDKNLSDKVGKNMPGDSPDANLNRVLGKGSVNQSSSPKFDLKPLEQPLKSIDETTKNFEGSFKLIENELKTQTQLLKEIKTNTIKIISDDDKKPDDKSDKKMESMLTLLKNVYKDKKEKYTPFAKKTVDKTKKVFSRDNLSKFSDRVSVYKGVASEKLGNIGSQIRAGGSSAIQFAKNAAADGLSGGSVLGDAVMAGGRSLMAEAALPVLGVVGAGAAGYAAGSLIHKGLEGTAIDDKIGSGVAHVAAFFGDKEAQQTIADNEKFKNFGALSGQMESNNNAGAVSSGNGDAGGKSYGAFQLSSKQGSVDKFLQSSGYADKFKGLSVGSAEFDAKWKDLAKNDKEFGAAQNKYAAKEYYAPTESGLKKEGIDLSGRGRAVKEIMMSTGVQYGASSKGSVDLIKKALSGKDVSKLSDKEIIEAIQNYKAQTVDTKFKSSSDAVKQGVANRIEKEKKIALALDDKEKGVKPADTNKDSGATKPSDKKTDVSSTNSQTNKESTTDVKTQKVDSYKKPNKDETNKTKISNIDNPKDDNDPNSGNVTLTDKSFDLNSKVKYPNYGQLTEMESRNRMEPFSKDSADLKRLNYLRGQADKYEQTTGDNSMSNTHEAAPTTAPQAGSKPADVQKGADDKGSKLEVRKTPSTIQRVLDRDFHLSV